MKRFFYALFMGWWLCVSASADGRRELLDAGWQFALGEMPADWRQVDLPHDWSAELPATKDAPAGGAGGYRQTGLGWYKKTLTLGRESEGRLLQLYFEGVYMNAQVYVNDSLAGGHPYGYSSFFVDITPYIRQGKNEIRVRVDNSQQVNSRWYTGSGIYRHVWLINTPKVHIENWGAQVTNSAEGPVLTVRVRNEDTTPHRVGMFGQERLLSPDSACSFVKRIDTAGLKRWSPDQPALYTERAELTENGRAIDAETVTYGWRTVEWDARQGLRLNGQPLKLNGACVHHDNGILGAASHDEAEYRKARLLKEAGFNAVRTSHNPPAEAFLRACDELGLLVIDEAFDGWREKKNENAHDYHELFDQWWQKDMEAMVLRDRNHPSIFCWSTGNEVIERKHIGVIKTAHQLATLARQLGDGLPVTSALAAWDRDWDIYDPLAAEHDIVGYNYMIHMAESDHRRVPDRVMMQTESYPRDAWRNYERTMKHPYIVGDFVWTGIDYLGESGIGRWYYEGEVPGESWERPLYPWNAAYCGDIDLIGCRKPISYYRSMLWNEGEPLYMAVREPDGYYGKVKTTMWSTWPTFESWTWPGWEDKPIEVEVYSRKPSVKLYLNDQLVGEQPTKEMKATFSLRYAPGTLRAEAGGETVSLATAGEPAALRLTVEKGQVSFVTIEVVDREGRLCPNADPLLHFSLKGRGQLLAVGNADIKDTAAFVGTERKAWKGRALCVVRGEGRLTVAADGLKPTTITIKTR